MVKNILVVLALVALPIAGMTQFLEFQTPKKLSNGVNTTGEESLPFLSPDGRQLFFARALYVGNTGGKFSGLDAWVSESGSEGWRSSSNNLPANVNNDGHNAIIGISRDGSTRYFLSAATNEKVNGIYATKQINSYWTAPEFIPVPGIDNQNFLGAYVSPDFDVMFFSAKAEDSRGEEDLYFSVKNSTGQWSVPKNMGATINTNGFEISPFLSPDKKRLYFASNGHGGEGDADIFFSERLYNSWETWSLPVNLGKTVNSRKFDAYFSIYGDSIAYFSSNRDGKFADIFEVRVAHGQTVLASGQRYISRDEWNRMMGGAVGHEIFFAGKNTSLNASQKELLFYVANRLQLQKDIKFHLVVTQEESSALSSKRLDAIAAHLVQSGITEDRLIVTQLETIEKTNQGKVEIRLIQ